MVATDHGEAETDEDIAILVAQFAQPQGEQAAYRDQDDAARRDPGEQQSFVPRHRAESEREQDGRGPHHEQQRQQEGDYIPVERVSCS